MGGNLTYGEATVSVGFRWPKARGRQTSGQTAHLKRVGLAALARSTLFCWLCGTYCMRFSVWLESQRPRVFYRGTNPGDTRRIKTGAAFWDSLLFAADNPGAAKSYGDQITVITAKPEAKIVYEGTREFISLAKGLQASNMLEWADQIAKRAAAAGYDAVWFKLQSTIGTAIIHPEKFSVST